LGAVVAAALAASACTTIPGDDLVVDRVRVVGARAQVAGPGDWADPGSGQQVTFSALVLDPKNVGSTVRWTLCIPRSPFEVTPCEDQKLLTNPESIVPAPPWILDLGTGPAVDWTVTEEVRAELLALFGQPPGDPVLRCSEYLELPMLISAEGGGKRDVAIKRVRIAPLAESTDSLYVRNANPVVAEVRYDTGNDACTGGQRLAWFAGCGGDADCGGTARCRDGTCVAPYPSGWHALCAVAAPGSQQEVARCTSGGAVVEPRPVESLYHSWFSDGGEFDTSGTDLGPGQIRFDARGQAATLWVLMRDGRGGESWQTIRLR
jgi:hypothetical protein